jgi:hypothetical protein
VALQGQPPPNQLAANPGQYAAMNFPVDRRLLAGQLDQLMSF